MILVRRKPKLHELFTFGHERLFLLYRFAPPGNLYVRPFPCPAVLLNCMLIRLLTKLTCAGEWDKGRATRDIDLQCIDGRSIVVPQGTMMIMAPPARQLRGAKKMGV
eukprot:COSAG05_NODE_14424_length_397_cov_0.718121_2_plen_106_part_01